MWISSPGHSFGQNGDSGQKRFHLGVAGCLSCIFRELVRRTAHTFTHQGSLMCSSICSSGQSVPFLGDEYGNIPNVTWASQSEKCIRSSKQEFTSGFPICFGNDRFPTSWFRQHAKGQARLCPTTPSSCRGERLFFSSSFWILYPRCGHRKEGSHACLRALCSFLQLTPCKRRFCDS